MAERGDGGPPSLAMVAAGGVGVLVVVAFVAAIAFGARTQPAAPGERVAVGRADADGTLAVFIPRCRSERVKVVEIAEADGRPLWRIRSKKGSIDERYVVTMADPPLGFETEVALERPLPNGELTATVAVDGDREIRDRLTFTARSVPATDVLHRGNAVDIASFQARALSAASCPESRTELGFTTVVFGLGALMVVGTYALMVSRWWRGRSTG